jgi:hypothetical protein
MIDVYAPMIYKKRSRNLTELEDNYFSPCIKMLVINWRENDNPSALHQRFLLKDIKDKRILNWAIR